MTGTSTSWDAVAQRVEEARDLARAFAQEARAYFGHPETNFPGTGEELAKVQEKILDCAALRERQLPAVARYLMTTRRATPALPKPPGS